MNAKEAKEEVLPPGVAKGAIRDNLEVVCFAVLLIMFFKTFVGQQFTIPSGSMRNTLMIGDHLLVNKFIFAVPQWDWEAKLFPMRKTERGDIVVFRFPLDRDQDYVKRCVALPGDTVEIRSKRLYVNGKLVTESFEHHRMNDDLEDVVDGHPIFKNPPVPGPWPEGRPIGENIEPRAAELWPYLDPEIQALDQQGQSVRTSAFRDHLDPVVVPPGHIFAMGDNRENSEDSRYWGFLPLDHLRGRPFIVWWSFREGGNDEMKSRVPKHPGDVLMNFWDGARHFFSWTRWERTGTIPR